MIDMMGDHVVYPRSLHYPSSHRISLHVLVPREFQP